MRTIAIDLGGTAVKLGRFDDGRLTVSREFALADRDLSLDELAGAVEALLEPADATPAAHASTGSADATRPAAPAPTGGRTAGDVRVPVAPHAIAIAVPGIVDAAGTRLVAAHGKYAELHDLDLAAWAEERFGARAVVENDARAALVGETSNGVARGARNAVLLTLGTGIGTAALVDGRPLRGPHGHAGILGGHVTVELDGPQCPCGNVGCAEAIASTWAFAEAAARGDLDLGPELAARLEATPTPGIRELVETRHEPQSAALLERFIDVWAAVVVTECHAFDPEVVVVTGGVLRAADVILPALTARVHAHLWSSSFRPPLRTPRDPATSVLRGLAALASTPNHEGHR